MGNPLITWRQALTDGEIKIAHIGLTATPFDPNAPVLREAATIAWIDDNGRRWRVRRNPGGSSTTYVSIPG